MSEIIEENILEKKISDLNYTSYLHTRAINCLTANGILTVRKLLSCNDVDLLRMRLIGKKSFAEIKDFINYLKNCSNKIDNSEKKEEKKDDICEAFPLVGNSILRWAWKQDCDAEACTIYGNNNNLLIDCNISEIAFPKRIQNILQKTNIKTFRQLLKSSANDFFGTSGIGIVSENKLREIIQSHTSITNYAAPFLSKVENLTKVFNANCFSKHIIEIKNLALNLLQENLNLNEDAFIQSDEIKRIIKECLYQNVNKKNVTQIDYVLPSTLKIYQEKYLEELIAEGRIEIKDGIISKKHPTFKVYISQLKESNAKKIIEQSIMGRTFNEISVSFRISKERVRQIIDREFYRMPMMEEDYFLSLFHKYNINTDILFFIFKPDEYSKYYIKKVWHNKGEEPISNILEDATIPLQIRKLVEEYLDRDVIDIYGHRIKRDFNEILDYIVKTYCIDYSSVGFVEEKYHEILKECCVDITSELKFQTATAQKIANRLDVLWSRGAKFRYYDISEDDFKELVDQIGFNQLSDIEVSSKYFFDRYAEILHEYDIRDEYELHNLLRKRLSNRPNVRFLKMPMIVIGSGSRKKQLKELLLQESPINQLDYAEKYESLYGVRKSVFPVSHAKIIYSYLYNGVYRLDIKELSNEEYDFLQTSLTENIYDLNLVKEIFSQKFPESETKKINSHTLRKLGFFICSSVVYRAEKENFDLFLKSLFEHQQLIDFSKKAWLIRNPTASYRLNQMKKNYEWFEYEPYKYISLGKLNQFIDGKKDIVSFAQAAARFCGGKAFSLHKLKKMGFNHKLFSLGFSDFFYNSILKYADNLNYCHIGSQYVFVEFPQTVSYESLINDIIYVEKGYGRLSTNRFIEK